MTDEKSDLAGPGIGSYEQVAEVLPRDYRPLLDPKRTMQALNDVKAHIEAGLCHELNLSMVRVPLIVEAGSGVNDMLDRDGSRAPVSFQCGLGLDTPLDAEVVQAATKWKRMALKTFDCAPGEGICTDMRAIRKDYFLDHDHSAYVDQWDWERAITAQDRTLDFLTDVVSRIWKVIREAEAGVLARFPELNDPRYPSLPEKLAFVHAEDLHARYPDLPRKAREERLLQEHRAVFIYGIGWPLADGQPHELRAADYDDWVTETVSADGRPMHGLNGDILVWNPVTRRRHELSSMGIRVTADSLMKQLQLAGQLELADQSYHQAILNDRIPLSIGGGIGQSRIYMLLLRKAHIGEVEVSVWPKALRQICAERNIHVLV